MKLVFFAPWIVGMSLATGGCGDGSNDEGAASGAGGTSGTTGGSGGLDWGSIRPPANIDITACAAILEDPNGATTAQCSSCCTATGLTASSFTNDGRCTCAGPRADGRDTVCSMPAQANTPDTCAACCDAAGFLGETWIGGGTMTDSTCSCRMARDITVCGQALASIETCSYCCLENGFLSSIYTEGSVGQCACIAP